MIQVIRFKFVQYGFALASLLALTALCVVWFWMPGTLLQTFNEGHRLGGDVITRYPENTLPLFRCAVCDLEHHDSYLYSECDLRETKDHEIVIFHDWDLARLVPDTVENRMALGVDEIGDQQIRDLTLLQIKSLRLGGGYEIPTLEEVLQCAVELKLNKPLLLEIKFFHSDAGRQRAISLAKQYRDVSGIQLHFSGFRRNIGRSFPKPELWLDKFASSGFRVYQVYRPKSKQYDLCNTW